MLIQTLLSGLKFHFDQSLYGILETYIGMYMDITQGHKESHHKKSSGKH